MVETPNHRNPFLNELKMHVFKSQLTQSCDGRFLLMAFSFVYVTITHAYQLPSNSIPTIHLSNKHKKNNYCDIPSSFFPWNNWV